MTDIKSQEVKSSVARGRDEQPKSRVQRKIVINKLATHVPDLVLSRDRTTRLPHSQKFEGVLMFADISGFTALCERYSMSSRSASGTDRLSRTLNDYLGEIVENILGTEGDVLKFAGDAFLALWKVTQASMDHILTRVIKCGLRIQERCDNWDTEVGVKLRVKIAMSIGPVRVTTVGNGDCLHFVLSGPAVLEANIAEKFALSGDVILAPKVWAYCPDHDLIDHTFKSDDKHIAVTAYHRRKPKELPKGSKIQASSSLPAKQRHRVGDERFTGWRRLSTGAYLMQGPANAAHMNNQQTSLMDDSTYKDPETTETAVMQDARGRQRPAVFVSPTDDEKARLRKYIIRPVLQKIDDDMPLEYLSEMRQVSVVFINLIFASGADIDESDSLQEAFSIIYNSMLAFEGCLNKVFMFDKGCTFLAIFGLPGYKHEDDCARALKCSYRIIQLLKGTNNIIQASIGVTTGASFCGVVGHVHRHEYTVIGRKVNMAARLMMHYPNKVSCDSETFHHSKQPRAFFHELPFREMKGVSDAGVIHEYIEGDDRRLSTGFNALSIPEFEYPLLGRDREMAVFMRELDLISEHKKKGDYRRILVFQGDPGIGKSRMLDATITAAMKEHMIVVPLALTLNDSGTPYYVVKLLIGMLLEMEDSVSHVEREHCLVQHIKDEKLREDFCLLNDLLVLKFPMNPRCLHMTSEQQTKAMYRLLVQIVNKSMIEHSVIFAIDDAHFIDNESWEFLAHLAANSSATLLLAMRSFTDIQPGPTAMSVLSNRNCYHIKLGPLKKDCMAALACQLMDVVQVPEELVKILQEKSHGIPSWCEQLIREMFSGDKLQLVPRRSPEASRLVGQITPDQTVLQKRRESSSSAYSGRLPRSRRTSVDEAGQTTAFQMPAEVMRKLQMIEQGIDEDERGEKDTSLVCIVSPGVHLQDLEIPNSMKGIIISRIDRMKATQQLIVKCGSVLGMTFTRKMLEAILPDSTKWRKTLMRRSIHALMVAGIFECALFYQGTHHTSRLRSSHTVVATHGHGFRITTRVECHCDVETADRMNNPDVVNCRNLRFVSALLQETLYEMLLLDQRKNLHRLSALYLESFAHRCEPCGGGEFLPGHAEKEVDEESDQEQEKNDDENRETSSVQDQPGSNEQTQNTTERNMGTTSKTSTETETTRKSNRGEKVLTGFRSKDQSLVQPLLESEETEDKGGLDTTIDHVEDDEDDASSDGDDIDNESDQRDLIRNKRRNTISLRKGSVDSTLSIISFDSNEEGRKSDALPGSSDSESGDIEFDSLDLRECTCADTLNSVLSQIVRHWRAAANTAKSIYFQLEAGAAAVATGNNMQALSYLHEAASFIEDLDAGHKPLPEDPKEPCQIVIKDQERAMIERLTGQAMFHMGRVDESMPHFNAALTILGNKQPTAKLATCGKLIREGFKQLMHVAFPRRLLGAADCMKWNHLNEQARCLSHVWHFHHGNMDATHALLASVQEVNRSEASNDDLSTVIKSYCNIMETCYSYKWLKLGRRYEKIAMQRCVSTPTEVGARELCVISHLYCVSMRLRLAHGNIQGAIDTGYSALKITEKLHDNEMAMQVLPTLVKALMVADRSSSVIEKLKRLDYAATEEEDVLGKGFYINGILDLVLETGVSLESLETAVQFCRQAATEPAFSVNTVPRFYMIASLALWYARLGQFDASNDWLVGLDVVMPAHRTCLTSVLGMLRLLECHLVNLYNCMKSAYQSTKERTRSMAKSLISSIQQDMKLFPIFRPRLLHMNAYYFMLVGNRRRCRKLLTECMRVSEAAGNLAELKWAQLSWETWSDVPDASGDNNKSLQERTWTVRAGETNRHSMGDVSEVEPIRFQLPISKGENTE